MPEHAEGPNQKRAEKKEQPARAFTPPKVLSEEVSKYAVRQDGILRIIGEGEIGDKARSLNRDAEGYRKAGLYVGERTVLAQSILEDFLRFNGICSTLEEGNFIRDIGKLILDPKAKFPPELEAAIAKEIASFPKSGLNEELLGRLPKTDYTRLEDCELDLDRFKKEAKSGLENADEQLLAPLFEKIKQAASSGDSWGIIKDEVDNGIRWLTTQKKVILNADYCAILTLIDGIEGDKEWMDYRAAHPHTPTFSIFRLNKYSCLCPAMGRSSAKGDDDGTGAYKSESASNSINEVLGAFKGVLASYFSPKAKPPNIKAVEESFPSAAILSNGFAE